MKKGNQNDQEEFFGDVGGSENDENDKSQRIGRKNSFQGGLKHLNMSI